MNPIGTPDTQEDMMTFDAIKSRFESDGCWGLLTSLDLKDCDPMLIRSKEAIQNYVIHLCDLLEVKRFEETKIVKFGENEKVAGYSMTQLIETSLVSGHFVDLVNSAYIDIFSCKLYNPYHALEFSKDFFRASSLHVSLRFR